MPFDDISKKQSQINIGFFTLGQIFTFMVFWLIQINLSWLAYHLSGSAFLLGILGFIINLPMLIFMPYAGVLSDKYSRKKIIILGQLAYLIPNLSSH